MTTRHSGVSPSFLAAVSRGFFHRCPCCGRGSLFRAYLKPVERCSACQESYAHIRADDGPAWLTVLLVGHVVVGAALVLETRTHWPLWFSLALYAGLAFVSALWFLPRAKGIFIGAIWSTNGTGAS